MTTKSKAKDAIAKGFAIPTPPPRTVVPEADAQRFEQAKPAPDPAPDVPPRKTKASSTKHAASRMRAPKKGERVTIYIPTKLAEKLRVRCAKERRSMSNAITDALVAWVAK